MSEERDPRAIDPLDALRAELDAVTVPAEFAARVRKRVADGHRVPRFQGARVPGFGFWFAGVATAAALILTAWIGSRTGDDDSMPSVPTVARVAEPTPAREPAPWNPGTPEPQNPRTPEPRNPGTPGPTFEVITTQPAILAEIWAAARSSAVSAVPAPIDSTIAAIPDIEAGVVEVSPVVVKWLVEPSPAVGFPLPFILRIAAADAARRPE